MRHGLEWGTSQATGFWPALGEIWKAGLSLGVLEFCAAGAVSPRRTNSQRPPDMSWREKVAGHLAMAGLVGVAIVVLEIVVALLSWLASLAV